MYQRMTREAEINQVWFGIITALAAKFFVVDFQV